MHLYYTQTIAENILRELTPYCYVADIAGSIRRQKEEVKDVEIVCLPKTAIIGEKNLFEEVVTTRKVIHPLFESAVKKWGTIIKGKFGGKYMQVETKMEIEGTMHIINIDLFTPRQEDYWRQFAIRTGSAEYARRYIANAWLKRGWCGVNGELRLIKECQKLPDGKWILMHHIKSPELPPVWESEKDFFRWLRIQWIEPKYRSL